MLTAQFAGQLDSTFADTGYVITNGSGELEHARALLQTPDGRIYVIGTATTAQGPDIGVARFLPNGEMDLQFGNNGLVTIHADWTEFGEGCALQDDGSILIAGMTHIIDIPTTTKGLIARLDSTGSLDTTFADGGLHTIYYPEVSSSLSDISVQSDNRIVACGNSGNDMLIHRTLPNGASDPSFGDGGSVLLPNSIARSMTIDTSNGSLIVAGSGIARILPNGELDSLGFGVDGWAVLPADIVGTNYYQDVTMGSDGRIMVTGYTTYSDSLILLRLLSNGNPDITFAQDGSLHLPNSKGLAVTLQTDGMIVVTGSIYDSLWNEQVLLARIDPTGEPDPLFGVNGIVVFSPNVQGPHLEMGTGIVIGSNANITISVGYWGNSGSHGFLVARFLGNTLPGSVEQVECRNCTVFPVPAVDEVTAECLGCNGHKAVMDVIDATGRTIHSELQLINATSQARVSLRGIPSGVYHLRIVCGSQIYLHTLIIQ